jgi:hypothetical protein
MMHKYTQAEFDALPIVDGRRQCPTGDYSAVENFGAWCRFGEGCIFGQGCSFGEECRFENGKTPDDWTRPYFAVDRIGSATRKAYFFSFGGVIHVRAGCFFGDEAAFLSKLDADNDARKTRQYRAALELARDVLGMDDRA